MIENEELKAVLDARGQRVYLNSGHVGYAIQWSVLSPLCRRWSRNRDVDAARVAEMLHFHQSGGYIPRIVHVAHVPEEGLVCYDGNHRRHVFNALCDAAAEDVHVIADVMFRASAADVCVAFYNVNKAVQVPAVYLEESDTKDDILALVKTYEQEYQAFVSTSSRCHCPNFNRDSFIDDVDAIHKYFNGSVSVNQIGMLLKRLNAAYASASHPRLKSGVLEKCRKHNFWLFIERHIAPRHLEALLSTSTSAGVSTM